MPQTIADRIQKAAALRKFTSDRSESGVDVRKMSDELKLSYEMCRRYAEGAAVPPPDAVRKIAGWLGVNVTWLLYGDGQMEGSSDINVTVLKTCLEVALDAQRITGAKLSTQKLASLVASLYKQAVKGSEMSAEAVAAALTALST